MAEEDLRLIGSWPSPFVQRVRIALNLKSVHYDFLDQPIIEPKSQLLLESNPVYKKIPVLLHNHKPIVESLIIVQYIDEVWTSSPSILPSHPYDRAVARFWGAYVDDKIFAPILELVSTEEEEKKKTLIDQLAEGIAVMEETFSKLSKGKVFFGGDQIKFVDIAFGSVLGWIQVTEKFNGLKLIDEKKTPGLAKWAENFSADSAVKNVTLDIEKLVEFAKKLQAKIRGQLSK